MVPEIGGVKQAVRDVLRSSAFATALDTLAAECGDGLLLPAPADDAVFTSEKALLPRYPACEIVGDGSDPDAGEDGAVQDVQAFTHRLALIWTAIGDDEEGLTATVERYVLATRRVLHGRHLETVAGVAALTTGREDYAPIGRRQAAGPFEKSGVIEVFVATLA